MAQNQSLYNIYRPNSFLDVVGQGTTTTVLKSILAKKSYRFNRNFIFHSSIGGVGKTTMARIFAKTVNCLNSKDGNPCNECQSCKEFDADVYVDFTGVDGKDYNTLEKVKPLVELAKHFPQKHGHGGMRVILIDEAQRMSTQAMSEFLSLFEFGVNHTIFIFTTTEIHKILHPIQTRCFKQEVKSITTNTITDRLEYICKKETIKYTKSDIIKLAEESGGSLREAIQLLSQFYEAYGEIVDLPISSRKDQFDDLIETAILGQFEFISDKLAQVSASSLYDDFSKYLFYHQRTNVRLIQDFLLYKPSDFQTMLLFLTMLGTYGGNSPVPSKSEIKTVSKEVIEEKPVDDWGVTPVEDKVVDSWEEEPVDVEKIEEFNNSHTMGSVNQTVTVDYTNLGFTKVSS